MSDEFHQLLKKFPLIASKNPQLNLLDEEELIQRLVESADRFRDITRAHPVITDSSIEWPTFDLISAIDGVEDRPLEPSWLTAMQTPDQCKNLKNLFEEISQQLAFALSRPCSVFEDRYCVRVEFLDCIAWVALKVERVIRMEVKDSAGYWQLSTLRFDLLKPMHTISWIDQVLLAWVADIVMTFQGDAEEAYDWLRGVRQQVRHHMSVAPGMLKAFLHIKRQAGMRQALMNTDGDTCLGRVKQVTAPLLIPGLAMQKPFLWQSDS